VHETVEELLTKSLAFKRSGFSKLRLFGPGRSTDLSKHSNEAREIEVGSSTEGIG